MVITIDGPAGSGKSTAARKLAARLEIAYLDTGAMYRAIAYLALQQGVDFREHDALLRVAESIELDLDCGPTHTRVKVNGHDVSEAIRSLRVSEVTPFVARHADIRRLLVDRQRSLGKRLGSFVSEGRDQGGVVFPGADAKFVLDATLERRAQRRYQEMTADGEDVSVSDVLDNLKARDAVDAKQWEPLVHGGLAIVIDTSDLSIPDVIERMMDHVAHRIKS